MMATETVHRLPTIRSLQVSHGESTKAEADNQPDITAREAEKKEESDARHDKAASFMAGVRLGSVQKQPRPGDVYRPRTSSTGLGYFSTVKQQRPLGEVPCTEGMKRWFYYIMLIL